MQKNIAQFQTKDREEGKALASPEEDSLAEPVDFEELITAISSKLIAVTCVQVDREIEHALTRIRNFFQVDRCVLLRVLPERQGFRITHAGVANNTPSLPLNVDLSRDRFPWCYRELVEQRNVVSIETLDALPPTAVIDRQSHQEWNIRSFLNIPIIVDGAVVYVIALNAVHQEQRWSQEFIHRLGLLGEIVVNAPERRGKSRQLEERLEFESLLAKISARFVNLSADRVDGEIEAAQQSICECLGLDLSTLWQWSVNPPHAITLTHLYRAQGGPPVPEPMDAETYFPWCLQQLKSEKCIAVSSTENVPAEAARDQEVWRHYGVKSLLTIPLSAGGGPLVGALSFSTVLAERTWPERVVKQLQLVAQIFANALDRKRTERELCEREARLSMAAAAANAGLWILEQETGHFWVTQKVRELFRFSPDEEITFEGFLTVVHPEDRQQVREVMERAMQSTEESAVEYRIGLSDGSIRWIASRGRLYRMPGHPDRLMGLSLDLTERKQLEEQLRERILEIEALKKKLEVENIYLRQEKGLSFEYGNIIGRSKALKSVLAQVEQVAPTDSTVLLTGETGTGKELIAQGHS